MMPVNRELLKQALSELVRLKGGTGNPTRILAQLYAAALEEWARGLRVDPLKLNKFVSIREAVSDRRLH